MSSSTSTDSPVVAHSSRVDLDTPKHYLNTLAINSTSPSPVAPSPAVILHGYGAGLGFFFLNYPALAQWAGRRGASVYAVDWLGMGRSARVPFTVKAKRDDVAGRVTEAESFFVDSLEQWRIKMGLEKMTLVAHSLGGYFSVVYALKYPTRVSKLVLLSPAGVPHNPNTTTPSRKVTDEHDSDGSSIAEQKVDKTRESRTRKLLMYLWEEGWSPFQVVRSTMFWSPMLIGKVGCGCFIEKISIDITWIQYSSRRFTGLSEEDTRDMHDYIMNITLAKGSGEYCICE